MRSLPRSWLPLLAECPIREPFHYISASASASFKHTGCIKGWVQTHVVKELVPGHGDEVRGTLSVELTIVVVLVAGNTVVAEGVVVDPNVGRRLNVNEISTLCRVAEVEVSDDDVGNFPNLDGSSDKT